IESHRATAASASSAPHHWPASRSPARRGTQQRRRTRIGWIWLQDYDARGAVAGASTGYGEPYEGYRLQSVRNHEALGRRICSHQDGSRPFSLDRRVRSALGGYSSRADGIASSGGVNEWHSVDCARLSHVEASV